MTIAKFIQSIAFCIICASCSARVVPNTVKLDSLKVVTEKREIRSETRHLFRNYAVAIIVFGLGIHYMGWDIKH